MPQKNIYVRDEDQDLFEEAVKLGGDSLSSVIAAALRRLYHPRSRHMIGRRGEG